MKHWKETKGKCIEFFNLHLGPATKGQDDLQSPGSCRASSYKRLWRLEAVKLKASCNDKTVHNKSCCAAWTHIDWSRQLHIFIYVYIYGYINTYTDVCVSVYIYMSINISIYIYTRVIYIYVYLYIYTTMRRKAKTTCNDQNLQWPGSGQASSHKRLWRHEAVNLKWSCTTSPCITKVAALFEHVVPNMVSQNMQASVFS